MQERTYHRLDLLIKVSGFLATAISIFLGARQFSMQQRNAANLEIKRNFWQIQNQVYFEVCKNAGAMSASIDNPEDFKKEKKIFLTHYYGELILVNDDNVEKCMVDLVSFLDRYDPGVDIKRDVILKEKVLGLSDACKNSSITFRPETLK